MRRQAAYFRVAIALIMGSTVSLAAAQAAAEQSVALPVATMSQAQNARRTLDSGAACLVLQYRSSVQNFLGLYAGSKDAARVAAKFNKQDCVGGASVMELHFSAAALRGAIYRQMYVRDFEARSPGLTTYSPDYNHDITPAGTVGADAYVASLRFGECVARRDTTNARALVLAEAESAQEMSALKALLPAYAPCMMPNQPEMTRNSAVAAIAEALYRISNESRAGA